MCVCTCVYLLRTAAVVSPLPGRHVVCTKGRLQLVEASRVFLLVTVGDSAGKTQQRSLNRRRRRGRPAKHEEGGGRVDVPGPPGVLLSWTEPVWRPVLRRRRRRSVFVPQKSWSTDTDVSERSDKSTRSRQQSHTHTHLCVLLVWPI